MKDIHRKEVPDAIQNCKIAGIKVRMVTGDNLITAKAIAKEIKLIEDGDDAIIMEGSEFIRRIGGVVCKKCRVKTCKCARDKKESEKTGEELRVDTI